MKDKIKYLVLIVAAGLMIYGIIKGDPATVLAKAAAVCLECIGIG